MTPEKVVPNRAKIMGPILSLSAANYTLVGRVGGVTVGVGNVIKLAKWELEVEYVEFQIMG